MQRDTTIETNDDRAVSPVIGVILMVAITVILAAVIGTFVLNMGSKVETNVQAGAQVSFDADDDRIKISFTSNQNADYLIANTSGAGTDGSYELRNVGSTVIAVGGGASNDELTGDGQINTDADSLDGNTVTVTVTAIKGDQRSVIITKKDTL